MYVLKYQILAIKNMIKVFLVKAIDQFIVLIATISLMLYYIYSLINENFADATLGENANPLIFIKTIYSVLGLILVLCCFSIMLISYKSSIDNWNKLKCSLINTDQIFIASIILSLMIISVIITFIIGTAAYTMKVNFVWTVVLIFLFNLIIIGNILFGFSIYKIINLKYKSKIVFYLTMIVTLGLTYYMNFYYFNTKSFEKVIVIDYIILLIPLILGGVLFIIFSNKPIGFLNSGTNNKIKLSNELFMKHLDPYIGIVLIELYRNIGYYLEFLIAPYILAILFKVLKFNVTYDSFIPILSLLGSLTIGFYYSYASVYKILPIKNLYNIFYRIIFAILIVILNGIIFSLFYTNSINIENCFELVLNTILIFNIINILKIPIFKYGKDNVMFFIVTMLIPALYKIIFFIFENIIYSYVNITISSNLILSLLNIILISYTVLIVESEKNAIL